MDQHGPAEPPRASGSAAAHHIPATLVRGGAALGWVDPPSEAEVAALPRSAGDAARESNACLYSAYSPAT